MKKKIKVLNYDINKIIEWIENSLLNGEDYA